VHFALQMELPLSMGALAGIEVWKRKPLVTVSIEKSGLELLSSAAERVCESVSGYDLPWMEMLFDEKRIVPVIESAVLLCGV